MELLATIGAMLGAAPAARRLQSLLFVWLLLWTAALHRAVRSDVPSADARCALHSLTAVLNLVCILCTGAGLVHDDAAVLVDAATLLLQFALLSLICLLFDTIVEQICPGAGSSSTSSLLVAGNAIAFMSLTASPLLPRWTFLLRIASGISTALLAATSFRIAFANKGVLDNARSNGIVRRTLGAIAVLAALLLLHIGLSVWSPPRYEVEVAVAINLSRLLFVGCCVRLVIDLIPMTSKPRSAMLQFRDLVNVDLSDSKRRSLNVDDDSPGRSASIDLKSMLGSGQSSYIARPFAVSATTSMQFSLPVINTSAVAAVITREDHDETATPGELVGAAIDRWWMRMSPRSISLSLRQDRHATLNEDI